MIAQRRFGEAIEVYAPCHQKFLVDDLGLPSENGITLSETERTAPYDDAITEAEFSSAELSVTSRHFPQTQPYPTTGSALDPRKLARPCSGPVRCPPACLGVSVSPQLTPVTHSCPSAVARLPSWSMPPSPLPLPAPAPAPAVASARASVPLGHLGASGSTLSPRFGRLLDMDVDSDSDECRLAPGSSWSAARTPSRDGFLKRAFIGADIDLLTDSDSPEEAPPHRCASPTLLTRLTTCDDGWADSPPRIAGSPLLSDCVSPPLPDIRDQTQTPSPPRCLDDLPQACPRHSTGAVPRCSGPEILEPASQELPCTPVRRAKRPRRRGASRRARRRSHNPGGAAAAGAQEDWGRAPRGRSASAASGRPESDANPTSTAQPHHHVPERRPAGDPAPAPPVPAWAAGPVDAEPLRPPPLTPAVVEAPPPGDSDAAACEAAALNNLEPRLLPDVDDSPLAAALPELVGVDTEAVTEETPACQRDDNNSPRSPVSSIAVLGPASPLTSLAPATATEWERRPSRGGTEDGTDDRPRTPSVRAATPAAEAAVRSPSPAPEITPGLLAGDLGDDTRSSLPTTSTLDAHPGDVLPADPTVLDCTVDDIPLPSHELRCAGLFSEEDPEPPPLPPLPPREAEVEGKGPFSLSVLPAAPDLAPDLDHVGASPTVSGPPEVDGDLAEPASPPSAAHATDPQLDCPVLVSDDEMSLILPLPGPDGCPTGRDQTVPCAGRADAETMTVTSTTCAAAETEPAATALDVTAGPLPGLGSPSFCLCHLRDGWAGTGNDSLLSRSLPLPDLSPIACEGWLGRGGWLLKYGQWGKPQFRWVQLELSPGAFELTWAREPSGPPTKRFPGAAFTALALGANSAAFRRWAVRGKEGLFRGANGEVHDGSLCFSVHTSRRSIDFRASTRESFLLWTAGLRRLLQPMPSQLSDLPETDP
eukprot:EG_transcript_1749